MVLFEVLDEMRRVAEAWMVGDFGNAVIGMEQVSLCVKNKTGRMKKSGMMCFKYTKRKPIRTTRFGIKDPYFYPQNRPT